MNLTKTIGDSSLTTKNTCKRNNLVGEKTDQRQKVNSGNMFEVCKNALGGFFKAQ